MFQLSEVTHSNKRIFESPAELRLGSSSMPPLNSTRRSLRHWELHCLVLLSWFYDASCTVNIWIWTCACLLVFFFLFGGFIDQSQPNKTIYNCFQSSIWTGLSKNHCGMFSLRWWIAASVDHMIEIPVISTRRSEGWHFSSRLVLVGLWWFVVELEFQPVKAAETNSNSSQQSFR